MMLAFLPTVPSIAPPAFSGLNTSAYSLQLHWALIPNDLWHGIPLGYTILYRETLWPSDAWNVSTVYGKNSLSQEIGNLTAYTNHTLKIDGFTVKGHGNFTSEIVVITGEDGKLLWFSSRAISLYKSRTLSGSR